MEGIFFKTCDGEEIPIKEVEGLKGTGTIIMQVRGMLRPKDAFELAEKASEILGAKVLVIDETILKISRLEQ